ncbi:Acyl-CoA hydrolase [Microlunatus sagamiharensis]|uniref:Acyl-CoA hydrolase n=1 Tax=Microlunatus sagamiharensis TaxID=546874 RepID=A0A1H2LL79_9ACTN|nr:hotdog domain-containing protein [Microlunatus sagamiharensis]SDU81757.1 Acyl-CoA hydrolase [Microlunatus sagamiharensis]
MTTQEQHGFAGLADGVDDDVFYEVAPVSGRRGQGSAVPATASEHADINFYTRKWIKPEDLNANGTLFGGSLLRWIDEEATIYTIVQLGNPRVVTKFISEINFVSSARQGDLVEMGLRATAFGRTSITMRARVRNMVTGASILTIERIVFVSLDESGEPAPHGFSEITYERDRFSPRGAAPTA